MEPFYKTESEVATLCYVRETFALPVPRVWAYNSSVENELGFEWVLMENVKGVTLENIWRVISMEDKSKVVREAAEIIGKMLEYQFNEVGNLYAKEAIEGERETPQEDRVPEALTYKIGPIVAPFFFAG